MIQNASKSGQVQAVNEQLGNQAMARSSITLSSGLDHIFSLGKNPLAPFWDATVHTEVLGDGLENPHQNEDGKADDNLDRQVVEQEL